MFRYILAPYFMLFIANNTLKLAKSNNSKYYVIFQINSFFNSRSICIVNLVKQI